MVLKKVRDVVMFVFCQRQILKFESYKFRMLFVNGWRVVEAIVQ